MNTVKFKITQLVYTADGSLDEATLCQQDDSDYCDFRQDFLRYGFTECEFTTPHDAFIFFTEIFKQDGQQYKYFCTEQKGPDGNIPCFVVCDVSDPDCEFAVVNILPTIFNNIYT